MSSSASPSSTSEDAVTALLHHYESGPQVMQHLDSYELPSFEEVARIVARCRALIFPGWVGKSLARTTRTELADLVAQRIDEVRHSLRRQLYRGLHHKRQSEQGDHDPDCAICDRRARDITTTFLRGLVPLRDLIATDVQAAYDGDPAATGIDEVISCYPGVYAITVYRIAHFLLTAGAPIIPRMMTELAHEKTGIDIHPGATIGESFFIDHGTGVVIGETSVIGKSVRIYQGVTLGALTVPSGAQRPLPDSKRHPTIEDEVVIYAGATILGGETVIGRGAVIGGNCWVTASVPPRGKVTQSPRARSRSENGESW